MSKKLVESTVLVGITGIIAASKAIELAKLLIEDGIDIEIVLSKYAHKFISTLSLQPLLPAKVYAL